MKIILGITGGIAAYKSCELVRLLKKADHQVRVVMTAEAEKFIGPLTFHSLSGEPVLRSLYEGNYDLSATSHIDLAQWGDLLVVAPATANFLAKYSCGIADDALTTQALAFTSSVLLAPAMNSRMWNAIPTQENYQKLKARGVYFIGPEAGELACGEVGLGKMSEPEVIFSQIQNMLSNKFPMQGKKVLVTSGPTRAYIDQVRFITNRSSGKMGHSIALAAERMGADVVLVTGPVDKKYAVLDRGKVFEAETGEEMLSICKRELNNTDFLFATAAVADYQMPEILEGKIRRSGKLQLNLEPSVDVLAELGKLKSKQIFVGFAAEAGEGEKEFEKAKEKMQRKNLDFLALNNITRKDIGFDVENNEVYLFHKDSVKKIPKENKAMLAEKLIWEAIESKQV